MARRQTFSIDGLNDILKQLEELGHDMENRKKVAAKKGAEYLKDKVYDNAPTDNYFDRNNLEYGTLKENIAVGFNPKTNGYNVNTGDGFWGQYLEFGTKGLKDYKDNEINTTKFTKKGNRRRRHLTSQIKGIEPKPFMEPTFNANKNYIQQIIFDELKKGLE